MTKKFIQLFVFLCFMGLFFQSEAQSKYGVRENVEKYFSPQLHQELTTPLSFKKVVQSKNQNSEFSKYSALSFDKAVFSKIQTTKPQVLYMDLPVSASKDLKLKLYKVDIFKDGFTMGVNDKSFDYSELDLGVHYRGVIEGKESTSLIALSFFRDKLEGFVNDPSIESFELTSLKAPAGEDVIMFRPQDRLSELPSLQCGNTFGNFNYTPEQLHDPELSTRDNLAHCVDLWLEANYNIYQYWGNDLPSTTAFCTALYNGTAVIYNNEQITMNLGHLEIWTSTSPYPDPSDPYVDDREEMLTNFQNYRALSFTGHLAELITQNNIGGVAAGFSGLCNNDRAQSMCISGMYGGDTGTYPNYSFNIYISSHELGHLYGSRHTHACVWNGNNTAIDGCAGYTEGGCPIPGYPPNGGTIMSYCWNPYYINFTEGFGPQPGAVIRNSVDNASCLPTCGGCQTPIVTIDADPNPVCAGGTLNLSTSGGASYAWSGPNGFTSSAQNPSIANMQLANAGTYSVTVTASGGCTKDTSIQVTVNSGAFVNQISNQAYCNGVQTNPIVFTGDFDNLDWTNDNTSIGLGASGTGNISSFTAVNNTNAPAIAHISVVGSFSSGGGSQIDQNQPTQNSVMAAFGQQDLAQSFKTQKTNCSGAGIELTAGWGTGGTVTISLWDNLPNAGGVMLASGSVSGTPGQWADVSWTSVPVVPGTTYYLVYQSTDAGMAINGNVNNPYPDGQVYANAGYGPFPDFDYTFRTYSEESLCPSYTMNFTITVNPTPVVTATPQSQNICSGSAIQTIVASSSLPNSTITWTRDMPQVTGIPMSGSGNISGTLTNNGNAAVTVSFFISATAGGCAGKADTVTVTVNPHPNATASATPNPACQGQLTWFTATGGVGYKWSGPNGFNIEGASFGRHMEPNMAGVYTVTVTSSAGCTSTASVNVSVTSAPNATANVSPNPACTGDLIQLSSNGGTTYAWSGPAGFTSTQQNPQIPNAKLYHSGTYTVTVTNAAGCTATKSVTLKVNETPVGNAWYDASTSCTGSTLQLHATGGGTYAWTGPGGFTSTSQNPTRANVNASHSGIYTVVITGLYGGCTSSYSVNVQIRPLPAITAWTTTPEVCEGDAAYLFASGGSTYQWSGPYGYLSNFQNPIIYNIPAYMDGIYTVTGTNEYGCTATASVYIDVQTVNAIVNATPNPVPYGGTLYLTASGGTFYQWTGPNGFYSYQQNPIIYKFTLVNAGLYSCVVSTTAGCQDTEIILIQVKGNNADGEPQLETRQGKYVQVFPNPTSQILKIDSDFNGLMNYTILGMDGKVAGSGQTHSGQEINVHELITGTYFIQWNYTTNGKTESYISKFVKTN